MPETATSARTSRKVIETLDELIHLELDAVEAYEAALDRLDDASSRDQLEEFLADHREHARELARRVSALGAEPARGPDLKRLLTQGRVVLARIAGDKAVLQAMRSNENDTNNRYERALELDDLDAESRALLERHLADERRHRAWIVQRIETLPESLRNPVKPSAFRP